MPTILLSKIYPKGSTLKNLRVGSTDVKYVKRGDGKLLYDTLKSTTYGIPSITLTYPTSNTPAAGGTTSPSSFSYSQSWYYTGHSGNTYSQSNNTSGATVSYSISGAGASINASTGVVTWSNNQTSSTRSATVEVTVTLYGQKNTATATVTQAAGSISYTLTKVLSAAYPALVSKDGGSINLYLYVEYTKTENGTTTTNQVIYNTSGTNGTLSGLTISGTGASVNSAGTVTWAANSGAQRSATVKGTFTYMGSSIAFEAKSDQAAGITNVTKYAKIEFRSYTGAGTFTVQYSAGGVTGSYQMVFTNSSNVNTTTISVSVPSSQGTVQIIQITRSDSSACKYYMNSTGSSSGQSLQWTLSLSTSSGPTEQILFLLPYPSC